MLDPETAKLARELMDVRLRERTVFSTFMNLWMAFNGWMECVTDAPTDAAMISALSNHQRLVGSFTDLMANSQEFREAVQEFAAMWPVLNVRDVRRKLGRDAFSRLSPEQLLSEVERAKVKHQPTGWQGVDLPTWSKLLETIYTVRCNLFHGSKSPHNHRDRELVIHSERVLRIFIERSSCFDWVD